MTESLSVEGKIILCNDCGKVEKEISTRMIETLKQVEIDEIKKTLEIEKGKIQLQILLWGPSLDTKLGKKRMEIISELESIGHYAIYSEDERYKEIVAKEFNGNYATFELFQAEKSDLIYIIPESPGSVYEFSFLEKDDLYNKSHVFINKKHRETFLINGPLKNYSVRGRKVNKFTDFDINSCSLKTKIIGEIDKFTQWQVERKLKGVE